MTDTEFSQEDRAFPFLRINDRQGKPRTRGVTEIRGPYYTVMGKHYLKDILDTMGAYVDVLKFAGGSLNALALPPQRRPHLENSGY